MSDANTRSGRIKRNVVASFVIKGWAGVVQLLLVPVTLLCLGTYNNGLWMIVVSLLLWIDNMDLGMGNGVRNKVAEYVAKNDMERARCCISTAFFSIFALMLAIALVPLRLTQLKVARLPEPVARSITIRPAS